ncbi:FtsX-like permease family protein [Candidatus Saccharibacteria bacterium]|nr:FtsX-like permease family protein [Candidatus Saccharibacteria bacterium]
MRIIDIIHDANANLLRNKLRSFLTILAIFIGSFSIISTSAIQAGVNDFIDQQVDSYGGDGYLAVVAKDSMDALQGLQGSMGSNSGPIEYNPDKLQTGMSPITDEQLEKIKKIDGIDPDSIVKEQTLNIAYVTSEKTDKKYLIGAEALPPGNVRVELTTGDQLDLRADEYQIILERKYVDALGYTDESIIGEKIKLVTVDEFTKKKKTFEAKVVGVIAPGVVSMGYSYTNNILADDIYNENMKRYPDEVKNMTYAIAASFDYKNHSASEIKDKLEEIGLSGMTIEDIIGTIKTFFDVILTVFKIFGFIALIAAAIGIINTLFMSVQERTREIGLDKALGMSSLRVFISFSLEAIMLGFWGSVFGITVSIILGNICNAIFHAEGGFLESFPTFNLVTYTIQDIIAVTALIMVIAFLAGTLPARRAAHKNPIDSLRYE